MDLSNSWYSYF